MTRLVLEAWMLLLYVDYIMHLRTFKELHHLIQRAKVSALRKPSDPSLSEVCLAVELACVFYFKRALCLQRSAVATLMLRRYGWQAQCVIGVSLFPSKQHAWVEMDCEIVNDKPYVKDQYHVLARL